MNRSLENIGLPKYASSMEELLASDGTNIFCFIRAMNIDSINVEIVAYQRIPINADGRALQAS